MLEFNEYLRVLVGLIAIVGPFTTIPLFLSITENVKSQRKKIARITAFSVGCILSFSVIGGAGVLQIFGISIDSFRVAGGLLLITIAFQMLEARTGRVKQTPEEEVEAIDSESVSVVPLALPLLAGPGAISTVILFSEQSPFIIHKIILVLLCMVISSMVWLCFDLAPKISDKFSQTAMNITMRVMGLILAAMAVEFIIGGIRNLLPGLMT